MKSPLKVELNKLQEQYKKMVIDSFIESCQEANMKENTINLLIPVMEVAFLEGIICERNIKGNICLN